MLGPSFQLLQTAPVLPKGPLLRSIKHHILPTVAAVAALGLGLRGAPSPVAGVDDGLLPENEAILDQLPHVLACVR